MKLQPTVYMKRIFVFLMLCSAMLLPTQLRAAIESTVNRISGVNISTGSMVSTKDDKYDCMAGILPACDYAFTNKKVTDRITLGVDHASTVQTAAYSYTFHLTVTYENDTFATFTDTISMVISYDPTAATNYKDKAVYVLPYNGSYQIKATIDQIYDNIGLTTILDPEDNIFLEVGIDAERYYTLNLVTPPSSIDIHTTYLSASDEIEVNWAFIPGAERYELEWTWVDDYNGNGGYISTSNLAYNFENNATRITTTNQYFRISNVFEHGYIVVRLRGVGKGDTNFDKEKFSLYTTHNLNYFGDFTLDAFIALFTEVDCAIPGAGSHESALNWQYSSTYAEEGKKKEVISYFDGSLRNRQSVTKSNTDNKVIAGETIYDHQGRGAIQVLPTPLENATIKFHTSAYGALNLNNSNAQFSRSDFDLDGDTTSCDISAATMKDDSVGASHYYSANNYVQYLFQSYVPNAEEYPYTQTEYTPDNTGRIRRQGGVGANHQLGSGHETHYFYGAPAAEQIDRLFGSEVGYSKHYKKNMVIDANGQVSVTYLDQAGRTIATALAGDSPSNLDDLGASGSSLTVDLLNKDAAGDEDDDLDNNELNDNGGSLVYSQEVLVTSTGSYDFHYDMAGTSFTYECLDEGTCYDCVYDLEINITDACGNNPSGFTPVSQKVGQISPFDTDCDTVVTFTVSPDPLTVTLQKGVYKVYKRLKYDPNALEFYLADYLADTNCVKSQHYFRMGELSKVDTSACDISCEACVTALGVESLYVAEHSQAEYDAAVKICREPCNYFSPCEAAYNMLLSDVSPGGQYGQFMDNAGNKNPSLHKLSVYNKYNRLPKNIVLNGTWKNPILHFWDSGTDHYYNESGAIVTIQITPNVNNPYHFIPEVDDTSNVTNTNGVYTVEPQHLLYVNDFIDNWDPEWAKSLVSFHPEYYYYIWCIKNDSIQAGSLTFNSENIYTSDDYDSLMLSTDTYTAAYNSNSGKIFNPMGGGTGGTTNDPYFHTGGQGAGQLAGMLNALANYKGSGYSIWEIVYLMNHCGTIYNATDAATCLAAATGITNLWDHIKTDKDWDTFKRMYLSTKQMFQSDANNDTACAHYAYNGCIGAQNIGNDPLIGNFQFDVYNAAPTDYDAACAWNNYYLYASKIKRFLHYNDQFPAGLNLGDDLNDTLNHLADNGGYNMYLLTGQCPNAITLQYLLDAMAKNNALNTSVYMSGYPEFTPSLYALVEAPGTNTSYVDYQWVPTLTGSTQLDAVFSPDACGVQLVFPACPYSWSNTGGAATTYDIARLYNLQYTGLTGSSYYFTVMADIADNTGAIDTTLQLTGFTCLAIGGCTFSDECVPNSTALEMQSLWNGLILKNTGPNDFGNTNVSLTTAYYTSLFNNHLASYISGGTGTWEWDDAAGNTYKLYDNSDATATYYLITFNNNVSAATSISNVKPTSVKGNFTAVATIGGTATAVSGRIEIATPGAGPPTVVPIDLGDCSPLEPIACKTPQNQVRKDLLTLFNNIATNIDATNSMLADTAFTSLLRSYILDDSGNSTFEWENATVSGTSNDTLDADLMVLNTDSAYEKCHFMMIFDNAPGAGSYNFGTILSFSDLIADETNMVNGISYGFSIIAHFTGGHTERLTGTSCFPLQNCHICNDSGDGIMMNFDAYDNASPGFTSDRSYNAACPAPDTVYTVTNNASALCSSASYTGLDRSKPNNGKYLFVKYNSTGPDSLWKNTQSVQTYKSYKFSVWYMDPNTAFFSQNVNLKLYVDGNLIATANIARDPGNWHQLQGTWNSGTNTSARIIVMADAVSMSLPTSLAIDDISFRGEPCDNREPQASFIIPTVPWVNDCAEHLRTVAVANADYLYDAYRDSIRTAFTQQYIAKCMGDAVEKFTMEYNDKEYHYTLYYYDQAGNLVRTVPPKGVHVETNGTNLATIKTERAAGTLAASKTYFTTHSLYTIYKYNTLNQLVEQVTPDGDTTKFWYDALGRLRFSQNKKQMAYAPYAPIFTPSGFDHNYSYTKYDGLGRIIEVGESEDPYGTIPFYNGVDDYNFPTYIKKQVTHTYYDHDLASASIAANFTGSTQENLRSRVSSVTIEDVDDGDSLTYNHGTHYSYDIHGNVDQVVQDNPSLINLEQFRKTEYEFDLISGKVNSATFQPGDKMDLFTHKYEYDADNRITNAYTSKDGVIWDQDAKYFYYRHGPLARTELGENKVQGNDYAYTIQGWIKGVNSNSLDETRDIGKDGNTASGQLGQYIGRDAYGYSLAYFTGDYASINNTYNGTTDNFVASVSSITNYATDAPELFNGNIRSMVTALYDNSNAKIPQLYTYQYDQLNRIKQLLTYDNLNTGTNVWSATNTSSYANKYKENFTYDANGNIVTLDRYDQVNTQIDQFAYSYTSNTNKLHKVVDGITGSAPTDDIESGQSDNNYTYDEIGNLAGDVQEEIANIDWNVYGKIKSITRTGSSNKPNLEFAYDASGNRIMKVVKPLTSGTVQHQENWIYTYYERDAQGNIMATYERTFTLAAGDTFIDHWTLKEQDIYGSSRVGVHNNDLEIASASYTFSGYTGDGYFDNVSYTSTTSGFTPGPKYYRTLGEKTYEESNHLGNVLTTISDKKIPVDVGSNGSIDYYTSNIISSQDYGAFGNLLSGRQYNVTSYPTAAFNGKRMDSEVSGTGNSYDYGFRIYNPRLGKFLSVDPLARAYSWNSPYAYAENDVVRNIDLDGLEKFNMTAEVNDDGSIFAIVILTSLDVSKGLQVSVNGAPPISNFKYKEIQQALGKVTVGKSPSSGEGALLLGGKEISKGNTAFSSRSSGSQVPEFVGHFDGINAEEVPREREGIVEFPSAFNTSATGDIYKDNSTTDFNPLVDKGSSVVKNAVNAVSKFKEQGNTTIKIIIGGGTEVGVDVKKARGEAIQKQIVDSGFKGKFEIETTNDKNTKITIRAIDGE